MEKLIAGRVAILISNGFVAGWYTLRTEYDDLVFNRQLAEAVLAERDILNVAC